MNGQRICSLQQIKKSYQEEEKELMAEICNQVRPESLEKVIERIVIIGHNIILLDNLISYELGPLQG